MHNDISRLKRILEMNFLLFERVHKVTSSRPKVVLSPGDGVKEMSQNVAFTKDGCAQQVILGDAYHATNVSIRL